MERESKLPSYSLLPTARTSSIVKAEKNMVKDYAGVFLKLATRLPHEGSFFLLLLVYLLIS